MKELLYLKDDQLKDLIEKLFIGYRETFSDSNKILDKYSIGLAHQKVIHLVSMYEGISISELLKKLKIDEHDFFNLIKNQDTKDKLKQFTQEAFEKEVFGAPTFIVNNKIFWGQDRLEYALDEIKKN